MDDNIPDIKIEDIKSNKSNKCAPNVDFKDGSCLSLMLLQIMAKTYNKNKSDKILLNDKFETIYPSKYKLYLLFEFQKRFGNLQQEWINNDVFDSIPNEIKNEIENKTFRPYGPQGQFEWLSTVDIDDALKQYKEKHKDFEFLGAVPIDFDEINYNNLHDLNFNDLINKGKTRIGIIFNLDKHNQSGSHWVSLFFDLKKGQIYFSDSCGNPPVHQIEEFIQKIYNFMKKNNITNIDSQSNKYEHQRGNTECGVYSINFILRLLKGKTFKEITEKRVSDSQVNKCRNIYFLTES
jgi:hypothetical protein